MMKPKYKIGDAFRYKEMHPDIIIVTGVIIRKDGRFPIYEMSLIDSDHRDTRKLYGYFNEEKLAILKHIEL